MKNLWAPWRMEYIDSTKKPSRCILCEKKELKRDDIENYILYRDTLSFVMMNLYPYNSGHLMISPYKHTGTLADLTDKELLQLMKLTQFSLENLGKSLNPDGYNVGINIGKTAGAGIDGHIHIHIVPRWNGDTNFMPVLSDIKVMPQYLSDTYRKLSCFFKSKH